MKLEDLLSFQEIVVQCHDAPDADAIASGFALWRYLSAHGKNVRLVYGGSDEIQKANLKILLDYCKAPLEFVDTLEPPELLVTVDCQYGQSNVRKFPARTVAVIDHHQVSGPLPERSEVRSGYGSCSTLLWKLLRGAGFSVDEDEVLSTVLYYGLYMDTGRFQEIAHPVDLDMRESLRPSRSAITRLQNANLSMEDLKTVCDAISGCSYEDRLAVAVARRCDPNLLGVIGDMIIEVETVDLCLTLCPLDGNVKFSVRSCIREVQANELAGRLCRELGESGGHLRKAGGILKGDLLRQKFGDVPDSRLAEMAADLLMERLRTYLREDWIIEASGYKADTSAMKIYRKLPVPVGYVRTIKVFPAGTEIQIRMLEGETRVRVTDDLCLMIGVQHEVYPISWGSVRRNYKRLRFPYVFDGEYPPTVVDVRGGERKDLVPYVQTCEARQSSEVWARQLDRRLKLFNRWDSDRYVTGEAGDWLVARREDPSDIYIVRKNIFEESYVLVQ